MKPRSIYPATRSRHAERGAALFIALIVLVILMLGGIAVMRSVNNALTSAGNLAFRRDLINQGEQAVAKAIASSFPMGAASEGTAHKSLNYSPVALAASSEGIPKVLLKDADFATIGDAANDLTGASSDVKIRYVVERLCNQANEAASAANCVVFEQMPVGGSSHMSDNAEPEVQPVYRVTVRVSGPRNTQVFIQNTFTKPEATASSAPTGSGG